MSDIVAVGWEELLQQFPGDYYLRYDGEPGRVMRAAASRSAWSFRRRSAYWAADWVSIWSNANDPAVRAGDVAEHFAWHRTAAADGSQIRGVTCNEAVPLPAHAEVEAANDWSWLWADSARAVGELAPVVSQVDHHDRRLLDLLTHSPTASHERDGQPPTAWFGIEEGDNLLSVAAVNRQGDCTFISSVVTHRDARGRGLASIVCGHATAWALQQAPLVALGMMTDNDVAARMYTRLGFICEKRWQSARFEICD